MGIILIAGSLQSYLFGIGHVDKGGARGILGRMSDGNRRRCNSSACIFNAGYSLGPLELVILGLVVSILGVFLSYNANKSNPASSSATARNFRLSQSKLRRARSCCSLDIWMYVSRG